MDKITVKDKKKSFTDLIDEAYKQLTTKLSKNSDIDLNNLNLTDVNSRRNYFSKFDATPIIESNKVIGVQLAYELKKKKTGGAGEPSTIYEL